MKYLALKRRNRQPNPTPRHFQINITSTNDELLYEWLIYNLYIDILLRVSKAPISRWIDYLLYGSPRRHSNCSKTGNRYAAPPHLQANITSTNDELKITFGSGSRLLSCVRDFCHRLHTHREMFSKYY